MNKYCNKNIFWLANISIPAEDLLIIAYYDQTEMIRIYLNPHCQKYYETLLINGSHTLVILHLSMIEAKCFEMVHLSRKSEFLEKLCWNEPDIIVHLWTMNQLKNSRRQWSTFVSVIINPVFALESSWWRATNYCNEKLLYLELVWDMSE